MFNIGQTVSVAYDPQTQRGCLEGRTGIIQSLSQDPFGVEECYVKLFAIGNMSSTVKKYQAFQLLAGDIEHLLDESVRYKSKTFCEARRSITTKEPWCWLAMSLADTYDICGIFCDMDNRDVISVKISGHQVLDINRHDTLLEGFNSAFKYGYIHARDESSELILKQIKNSEDLQTLTNLLEGRDIGWQEEMGKHSVKGVRAKKDTYLDKFRKKYNISQQEIADCLHINISKTRTITNPDYGRYEQYLRFFAALDKHRIDLKCLNIPEKLDLTPAEFTRLQDDVWKVKPSELSLVFGPTSRSKRERNQSCSIFEAMVYLAIELKRNPVELYHWPIKHKSWPKTLMSPDTTLDALLGGMKHHRWTFALERFAEVLDVEVMALERAIRKVTKPSGVERTTDILRSNDSSPKLNGDFGVLLAKLVTGMQRAKVSIEELEGALTFEINDDVVHQMLTMGRECPSIDSERNYYFGPDNYYKMTRNLAAKKVHNALYYICHLKQIAPQILFKRPFDDVNPGIFFDTV